LFYVGDVMIGEYFNIGVLLVFVNYDGVFKVCIIIGSYCCMGLDNMFVVLVSVGDGVYFGVGIVICKDVFFGVLVINVVF